MQTKMITKIKIVLFAYDCMSKTILSFRNDSMKVRSINNVKVSEIFKAKEYFLYLVL